MIVERTKNAMRNLILMLVILAFVAGAVVFSSAVAGAEPLGEAPQTEVSDDSEVSGGSGGGPAFGGLFALLACLVALRYLTRPKNRPSRPPMGGRHSRTIPQDVKIAVAHRDGGKCRRCGSTKDLQYDHIHPWSLGGRSDDPNNIQLLCGYHNRLKGNR